MLKYSKLLIALLLITGVAIAKNLPGTTVVTFSANPITLVAGPDVTVTTTTTSTASQQDIDKGKVKIQIATDGLGNPVPAEAVVTWVTVNPKGQKPVAGVTNLAVDLDNYSVTAGMTVGFRAHYVTGGGKNHVETHFSAGANLVVQ
jgi:hypothetical protein